MPGYYTEKLAAECLCECYDLDFHNTHDERNPKLMGSDVPRRFQVVEYWVKG
jgi:hypothetical protein